MPPKLALNVGGDTMEMDTPIPGSLVEMAQARLNIDVSGDEGMCESFMVTDGGTLQLLSESYSNYNINSEGMSKASTPQAMADSPATPGVQDEHYNCKQSELRKVGALGKGASGTVFKAVHEPSKRLVALKEISVNDKNNRDQMLNEVRTLCCLPELEGLVKFFGAFYTAEDGKISIALEYMNAGSLEDLCQLAGGKIPEHILSAMCHKILIGMKYLHQTRNLVHRDIKPANLLMNLNGEPKITDFGISSTLTHKGQCDTNIGTFAYMSPERLNNSPYSHAADIWSIGLTLLELATGQYPYKNSAPVPFILEVTQDDVPLPSPEEFSSEFLDFLSLCMQKDPEDRPPATALLGHNWIKQHKTSNEELATFVRSLIPDSQQRIDEDLALTS